MILEGSERYAQGKDWSKMFIKVIFLDPMAFLMHINVKLNTFSRITIKASAIMQEERKDANFIIQLIFMNPKKCDMKKFDKRHPKNFRL